MPTPNNNGNRKFDFGKPQKRTFDFTKDDPTPPRPLTKEWWKKTWRDKKAWIGVAAVVFLLGIICFSFFTKSNTSADPSQPSDLVAEVGNEEVSSAPEDSIVETSDTATETAGAPEREVEEILTDVSEAQSETVAPQAQPVVEPATSASTQPMAVAQASGDVESEAMKVIRGDYGVGQERKDKLGSRYQPIQNRVNELKREGVF